ncbi:hypothetical protein RWV98_05940 [Agathobaculum sp. NTUH-O15-33]|nr:hypothetical protein [Agathobaculum sp. NTUH-O15-33]WNX85809.1 hypothetical protein RWV98_05940 [Agathobaculum sp. NTUH-O15-33]
MVKFFKKEKDDKAPDDQRAELIAELEEMIAQYKKDIEDKNI